MSTDDYLPKLSKFRLGGPSGAFAMGVTTTRCTTLSFGLGTIDDPRALSRQVHDSDCQFASYIGQCEHPEKKEDRCTFHGGSDPKKISCHLCVL